MGPFKLRHLKLEIKRPRLRRSVLCVRESLGKTRAWASSSVFLWETVYVTNYHFFFKGILFPDESRVSRPLVVCWIISGEQQGDWSFEAGPPGTKAKGLQPPRITRQGILGNATSCTCCVHERVSASERACLSASDRVLRVQICIRRPPLPRHFERAWQRVCRSVFQQLNHSATERRWNSAIHVSPCHSAAKTRIMGKCTRRQRTKHGYWFTVPLSKQRMATSPPKLSVIFDFDIE